MELNPPYTSIFPKKFDVYHLCEQYKLQHLSPTNNSPGPSAEEGKRSKKGVKRGREVSIYQQYSELDVELQRNSPLWRYLTELATYPGHSDEFISRNQYICDQTITQDS